MVDLYIEKRKRGGRPERIWKDCLKVDFKCMTPYPEHLN